MDEEEDPAEADFASECARLAAGCGVVCPPTFSILDFVDFCSSKKKRAGQRKGCSIDTILSMAVLR
jgi:hypothetical protein